VVDRIVLWLIAPLAIAFLIGGADDLAIDLAWIYGWVADLLALRRREFRKRLDTPPVPIAIMVPLWKESQVIQRMLEHNLAAIRYPNYHIFAGIYANDPDTEDAVAAVSEKYPNVHLAVCPHGGPTSKADCLNWIYQHVGLYEQQNGMSFEIVVTHDAEDIIHPEELTWINACAVRYDFIQIPVLALATPFWNFTHGVYCDEFAEYHSRDMVVRSRFGCFVPGAGVGTGYRRAALEALAQASSNRVFEPQGLTEDYEAGLRLRRLGFRQVFVPLTRLRPRTQDFVATREYFPRKWRMALRQRTRWVTGIALQGWERFGWSGTPGEIYWLWRDRKGLIGSPLGMLANAVFLYGLATALWNRFSRLDTELISATFVLQIWRMAIRMGCVARVYGLIFALGVPVRAIYANLLNATATGAALFQYASAKFRGRPLRWLKTDHSYPNRAALLAHKRQLGEILLDSGFVSNYALNEALSTQPQGIRLGEYLIRAGALDEHRLYEALSLQQGLPVTHINPTQVPRRIAHALPEPLAREWRVLPFRVSEGSLFLAGPDLPTPAMTTAMRPFTSLEIRFHLLASSEYKKLADALL
jgi:adsorption protein B